ncbi:chromate efflux transporter [Granulosicoccus sp. 3-233]|uniref:chromate efflux transporter n=1 Tax=Granulosicoccus sp. 3-233 TaxID=3417969 RepID=UPI003D330650
MSSVDITSASEESIENPTLLQAFSVWLKIGLLSFGGPAAQIALMHRMVVTENRWLSEKQYINALSFCMLLPGPEAMQLATYAGWRMHGVRGGLLAGLLFVIPGAIIVLLLAAIYTGFGKLPLVDALFLGVKAAVVVIVIEALLRVSKKALKRQDHWVIAALAFIAIFFFNVSFPLIVIAAGLYGFLTSSQPADLAGRQSVLPSMKRSTIVTVLFWACLWAAPLVAVYVFTDNQFLLDIGAFFSRLAVVTFGGAYAVLAYMTQDVVVNLGWLTAGEMMDGLGLAETTPGPLILVTEFVGFVAGYREGGVLSGLAAATMTLWVTFVPCFLWIFAGAPYIDWIGEQPRLRGALSSITAAVVGVILNLSVWFSLHVLFATVAARKVGPLTLWTPGFETLDWRVLILTGICAVAVFVWHWSILKVLLMAAILGLLTSGIPTIF